MPKDDDVTWRAAGRHSIQRWIYGLWYPALLGSLGILTLLGRHESAPSSMLPWEWLVIVYLTIQFGEGSDPERHYDRPAIAHDALEIGAMAAFFVSLLYFTGPLDDHHWMKPLQTDWGTRLSLAVLFAVPVVFRIYRICVARARGELRQLYKNHWVFYLALTLASSVSFVLVLLWPRSWCAFGVVCALLLLYLVIFVLFNHAFAQGPDRPWARPTSAKIDTARSADD
ncbi:hypothetical protein K3181_05100 [Qipengyuania sp. YG27]|uniref:Transmembrane protein n=1 Tax=Qipengyuania mesophila TaxID=2867246 RepID=A0ABS7JT33_9SPHN|nr:hypothetical protein [Qipengyuania mesophila]MBX7500812.1 hypothetical protein [Qipengyuania mesophila]